MMSRIEPCKTQPRPILKKSQPPSPLPASTQPKFDARAPHPFFFSGNESYGGAGDNSNDNGEIFLESDPLDSPASQTSPSLPKSEKKKSSKKSVTLSQDEDARFKVSHLTRKLRESHLSPAQKRAKHLSAIYVFHSREINKEIIKTLIKSTDGFIKEFRRDFPAENYTDIQLFTVFRSDFVKRLKKFLVGESEQASQFVRPRDHLNGHEIAFTLSEPIMADVESYRRHIEKENQLLAHSKTEATFNYWMNSPGTDEEDVAASLPTKSFFDSYQDEIALRENVMLKTYRSKSIESDEENLLNVQMSQALSKKNLKEKASSIVTAATTTKKIVRFADAFGLDLEKVKIITNNSFVDAFSQDYNEYDDDSYKSVMSCEATKSGLSASSQPFLVLIPLFNLRKVDSFIRLDDYIYDYENKIIRCIVKVKNVCYQKQVFARITNNNWKSHWDLNAMYVKSDIPISGASPTSASSPMSAHTSAQQQHHYDYFSFFIVIPERSSIHAQPVAAANPTPAESTPSSVTPAGAQPHRASTTLDDCILRIEFALCCKQNGQYHWDNNFGDNYKFQCFFNKTS